MRYILVDDLDKEIDASPVPLFPARDIGRFVPETGSIQLLLSSKFALRKNHITRIKAMGIAQICIQDPLTDDIEIREPIDEEMMLSFESHLSELQNQIYPIFQSVNEKYQDMQRFSANFRHQIHGFMAKSQLPSSLTNILKEIYEDFFFKFRSQKLYPFVKPLQPRNYLSCHSIFSALLAAKIQVKLGANHENIWNVFAGAALQDVAVLPNYFTNADIDIEEEKIFRQHPKLGLMVVNETPLWNPLMGILVLNHHRYLNNSGFPLENGSKRPEEPEKEMHLYGKIGSLTCAFGAMLPFFSPTVINRGFKSVFNDFLFDKTLVEQMTSLIELYPTGLAVELSTGERGIVKQEGNDQQHFLVRIIYDSKGNRLTKKVDLKLSTESNNIKAPWYVNPKLKRKVLRHFPEVLTTYLEKPD